MTILYFDLETVPDQGRLSYNEDWLSQKILQKSPDLTDQEFKTELATRLSTTPETLQIVGLSIAWDNQPPSSIWGGDRTPDGVEITETRLLKIFWQQARKATHLVGYNCLWFDIPSIQTRSALLGVRPSIDLTNLKPWENVVIDLFRTRFPRGDKYQFGLKDLGKTLNLPIPESLKHCWGTDGGNASQMWGAALETGDFSDCKDYGKFDIALTRELARLWSGHFFPSIIPSRADIEIEYAYIAGGFVNDPPEGY